MPSNDATPLHLRFLTLYPELESCRDFALIRAGEDEPAKDYATVSYI